MSDVSRKKMGKRNWKISWHLFFSMDGEGSILNRAVWYQRKVDRVVQKPTPVGHLRTHIYICIQITQACSCVTKNTILYAEAVIYRQHCSTNNHLSRSSAENCIFPHFALPIVIYTFLSYSGKKEIISLIIGQTRFFIRLCRLIANRFGQTAACKRDAAGSTLNRYIGS